VLPGQPSG
jgi:hypothetical protein